MRFRKTLFFPILAMGLVFALSGWALQKPFTQEQVREMVRAGLGDESGAKLIEQRGIDFTPAQDFMQNLKAAGATDAFLRALREAKPPEPASAKNPLDQVQVIALLGGQVPSHRVAGLVRERGIDFDAKDDYLQEVRLSGGDDELINALKSAKLTKPKVVDPTVQTEQTKVRLKQVRLMVEDTANDFACGRSPQLMKTSLEGEGVSLYSTLDRDEGVELLAFHIGGECGNLKWSLGRGNAEDSIASGKQETVESCLSAAKATIRKYQGVQTFPTSSVQPAELHPYASLDRMIDVAGYRVATTERACNLVRGLGIAFYCPVTLTNIGGDTLTISSINVSGEGFVQTNKCEARIDPGGSCEIDVDFNPTTMEEEKTGILSVYDNASGSPHTFALHGVAHCSNAEGLYGCPRP